MNAIQIITQWALLALVAAGLYSLWRMNEGQRASERLQQAQRRAIVKHKRTVERMVQLNNRRAEIDERRNELNDRYEKAIKDLVRFWEIEDREG